MPDCSPTGGMETGGCAGGQVCVKLYMEVACAVKGESLYQAGPGCCKAVDEFAK